MAKGRSIAYRLDPPDEEKLDAICEQTDLSPSEISRRAMKHFLQLVEREGSIAFLFDGIDLETTNKVGNYTDRATDPEADES